MSKNLTDKQKQALIIAGILVVLTIAAFIYFYNAGKSKGKQQGSVNISNTPTDPGTGNTASASTPEINTIATQLYQDMKGLNLSGHDNDLWSRWMILSDTDFIRVSNRFNEEYQTESGQTLKEWIEDEGGWGYGAGSTWSQLKDTVLARMGKLNIK